MSTRTYRLLASVFALPCAAMLGFGQARSHPVPAPPEQADCILVVKSEHTLTLYYHGAVIRTYKVALGRAPGAKEQQGDNRTPAGHYRIDGHNPHSAAHLSLHISYPNAADRAAALAGHRQPGGDIMIHGLPNGFGYIGEQHRQTDWTYGCIAVTDGEMDEIFRLVPNGTPIDIEP